MLARVEDDYNEIEGRFEKFQYIMDRNVNFYYSEDTFSTAPLIEKSCSMKLSHVNWRDFRLAAALIRSRWVMIDDVAFLKNPPKWLKVGTPDDQVSFMNTNCHTH